MCIITDTPVQVLSVQENVGGVDAQINVSYKVRSVHRRKGNSKKCIWTLNPKEEVDCFRDAASAKWLDANAWSIAKHGWGLKVNANGGLEEVGISDQGESLKIAKFVDSSLNYEWHGYPADYSQRKQDKPPISVLADWKERRLITKTQMSKIKQFQRCNL
jgi:hypothetical protein